VLITAPYFHDGSQATLWDVLDHSNPETQTPWGLKIYYDSQTALICLEPIWLKNALFFDVSVLSDFISN